MLLPATAAVAEPLSARNLAPVSGLIGFPALRDASVLERETWRIELQGSLASSYGEHAARGESIVLDGETAGLTARMRYGLGDGWELEAEASWRRHSAGFLDRWIEGWHDLWGLPDGGRPDAPRDRLDYSYRGATEEGGFALREPAGGLSDIHVAAVRHLWHSEDATISVRAGGKLGVGDEERLLGGGHDYYVSVNATRAPTNGSGLVWHAQLGYLRAGRLRILDPIQERNLWFTGAGVEWPVWRNLTLKTQVDAHAPVADSALTELGDVAFALTVGMTWSISPEWQVDLGFSEDIAPHTGPDFVPRAGIRYVPGPG